MDQSLYIKRGFWDSAVKGDLKWTKITDCGTYAFNKKCASD